MSERRYRMTLAYDGTRYAGWQVQPGQVTVQGECERVLAELTGESPRIHCSGRTDRGVHAREQVAHFDLRKAVQAGRLRMGFNALLQEDIRVMGLRPVASDFHARLNATAKEYRYHVWNGGVVPPPLRFYRLQVRMPLDVDAMRAAARQLKGRHDFAAFSANPNREVEGTVRRLDVLRVRKRGRDVVMIARGEGFLYKMVRSLAGFLLRVGTGEVAPALATDILRSKVRTARVPTAPPRGLFLWKVHYD